jgi:hypothetical protein
MTLYPRSWKLFIVTAAITYYTALFLSPYFSVFFLFSSFFALFYYSFPQNKFGLAATLETPVLEMTGSTLGRDIGYPE